MKKEGLLALHNSLLGGCSEVGVGSFFQISKDRMKIKRMRGNSLKLCE